jgi:TRAP transporter 4TM/12TM fusion protein
MNTTGEREDKLTAQEAVEQSEVSVSRHRHLSKFWWTWLLVASIGSVLVSIYVIFGLGNRLGLYVPLETEYFYLMLGMLLPLVFLLFPFRTPKGGAVQSGSVPWYDLVLAAITIGLSVYFLLHGNEILQDGWEYLPPETAKWTAFAMWALVLEATRRTGGTAIFVICVVFSIYPVFASDLPGILNGQATSWTTAGAFYVFGTEGVLGIPMRAFANLVVGFLVFGVALQYTGGGAFFLNLAFALLGKFRGGPAKVAIFASGLMGSMSGSVITNVLTTGVMSIPAMKRVGFRGTYAGGVEACASTGGVLMPPVMGATAFVMATFLEVPYSEIVLAAVFPSLLYYFGLFMQIDAYAGRYGLKGLPVVELPKVLDVLKDGWYFIFVLVMLVVMLLYMQREAQAPYYATATLLVINQLSRRHRWNLARLMEFLMGVGKLFTELAGLLAGVGLIIGALMLSGKIGSLAYDLVALAGENVFLLLLMGAVTSFILGIGMTVTAAYLFLAVTVGPALIHSGLDKIAVHLFLLYWGMISFITPPVAIGAFAAATVAQSNPMKTGLEAMRLGSIIYFVPFFFVLNPALIGRGEMIEVLITFSTAVVGVVLVAGSLQGYLVGIGRLMVFGQAGWICRGLLLAAGIIMMLPGGDLIGHEHSTLNIVALCLAAPAVLLAWIGRKRAEALPEALPTQGK